MSNFIRINMEWVLDIFVIIGVLSNKYILFSNKKCLQGFWQLCKRMLEWREWSDTKYTVRNTWYTNSTYILPRLAVSLHLACPRPLPQLKKTEFVMIKLLYLCCCLNSFILVFILPPSGLTSWFPKKSSIRDLIILNNSAMSKSELSLWRELRIFLFNTKYNVDQAQLKDQHINWEGTGEKKNRNLPISANTWEFVFDLSDLYILNINK